MALGVDVFADDRGLGARRADTVRVGDIEDALAPGVKVQGVTVEGYAGHNTHGLRATPATTPTA